MLFAGCVQSVCTVSSLYRIYLHNFNIILDETLWKNIKYHIYTPNFQPEICS